MFRRTLPCKLAMVSTHGGMRRILKNKANGAADSILRYMRQAVESGTYRTTDEIDAMLRARARASGLSAVDLNQPDFEQDDGSGLDDITSVMRRFRQDIVRGAKVEDYPVEYMILRQYPPIPNPPRTPAKVLRRMERQRQERARMGMQPLVQSYLKRQQQQQKNKNRNSQDDDGSSTESSSTEDYYRRLLGVRAPPATTLLGQRTAAVQKAYAAAMAHYQLERQSGEKMSDAEIAQQVDELLAKAQKQHAQASREMTQKVQQWRREQQQQEQQQQEEEDSTTEKKSSTLSSSSSSSEPFSDAGSTTTTTSSKADSTSTSTSSASTNNLLGNDTTKVHAMLTWSRRLQAVPYRQWTVGASTALDHWIARQVLDLQEATWQSLLEADNDDNDTDVDMMELGRQIVAVRESLFPETLLESDMMTASSSLQDEYSSSAYEDDYTMRTGAASSSSDSSSSAAGDSVEKSIEELLASLGSMSATSSSSSSTNLDKKETTTSSSAFETPVMDVNESNKALDDWTDRLQDWRRRRRTDTSFNKWPADEKDEFRAFVREYTSITHNTTRVGGSGSSAAARNMNLFSKREDEDDELLQVLLEHPPVNKTESDAFWNALQTKHEASALLESFRAAVEDATRNDDNENIAAALSLADFFIGPPDIVFQDDNNNTSEQLDRLLNLGALRPLLDEYVSEEERIDFWTRHGDVVFANVPLEHLIPVDPDDPDSSMTDSDSDSSRIITGRDLEGTPLSRDLHLTLSPQSRFLLKTMPFREDASSLLQAWNEHKSSRARYEEELFQTGRLGLRYTEQDGKHE